MNVVDLQSKYDNLIRLQLLARECNLGGAIDLQTKSRNRWHVFLPYRQNTILEMPTDWITSIRSETIKIPRSTVVIGRCYRHFTDREIGRKAIVKKINWFLWYGTIVILCRKFSGADTAKPAIAVEQFDRQAFWNFGKPKPSLPTNISLVRIIIVNRIKA